MVIIAKVYPYGGYRAYGYKNRVWKAVPVIPTKRLTSDTLMKITDAHGNTEKVAAGELSFS